jgi:hypothetical protein
MNHALCTIALASAVALGGCAGAPAPTFDGPVYPGDERTIGTLNVQAVAGDRAIVLNSGEARSIGPARVWLNQWWAAEIPGLPRGEEIAIPLSAFRDEAGLPPREGGFFATRDKDEIVLVELLTAEGLYGVKLVAEGE